MPFITGGGIFVPTSENFFLGDLVVLKLLLPGKKEHQNIEGKIVWITPKNALYEIYPGVGIQFLGDKAKSIHDQIRDNLDNTMDVGGYTYGLIGGSDVTTKSKNKND